MVLLRFVLQSLSYYRGRTALLGLALALTCFVPMAVVTATQHALRALGARARATPLVLGAAGSETDLVLQALYFRGRNAPPLSMSALDEVAPERARVIPLHLRFQAKGESVIGTTEEYFSYRRLTLDHGAWWQRLGDCVLGHQAAARLQAEVGSKVTTDAETIFNLAADHPLRMRVVGVLAPTGAADDEAIFVSLETAWIIEGIGHGHQPEESPNAGSNEGATYTEVTDENVDSFHFHGRRGSFPCSAAIVLPVDERGRTLLLGQFANPNDPEHVAPTMLAEPAMVMSRLLATILRIRATMIAVAVLMGLTTIALALAVIWLSLKIRRREFQTLARLGASRSQVAVLAVGEPVLVLSVAVALAFLARWATERWLASAVWWFV